MSWRSIFNIKMLKIESSGENADFYFLYFLSDRQLRWLLGNKKCIYIFWVCRKVLNWSLLGYRTNMAEQRFSFSEGDRLVSIFMEDFTAN